MTAPVPPSPAQGRTLVRPKLAAGAQAPPAGFLSRGLLRTAKAACAGGAVVAVGLAVLPAPRGSESFDLAFHDWRAAGPLFDGTSPVPSAGETVAPRQPAPPPMFDAGPTMLAERPGRRPNRRVAALGDAPGGPVADTPAAPLRPADRPVRDERPAADDREPASDIEDELWNDEPPAESDPERGARPPAAEKAVPPAALLGPPAAAAPADPPEANGDDSAALAAELAELRAEVTRLARTPADSPLPPPVSRNAETVAAPPAPLFPDLPPDPAARFDLDLGDGLPLPSVLASLGRASGLNVVAAEDVTGTVTASLRGVTAEEALTALGRAHGFTHSRDGRFVYVTSRAAATAAAEAARARAAADATASRRVVTRLYRPHYVSAQEVVALLTPLLTPGVGVAQATAPAAVGLPLSGEDGGGDSLAQRDAVVVRDYPEALTEIDALLAELDVPPAQVAIEAVILRVALTDETSLGVNFALLDDATNALAVTGAGTVLASATGVPGTAGSVRAVRAAAAAAAVPRYGAGFSTGAAAAGLRLGTVSGKISSFVEALEAYGAVSTVATPSVRVLNKQRGEVVIGQRLGFRTTVVNGAAAAENVQFIDAGTKLVLRPFVAPDGLIRMEVHPEKSTGVIDANGIPQLDTTEVTTNVMVRDGQTVLIAGLMEDTITHDTTGIPVLGSLPLVGGAFRQTKERVTKSELIVLLTPRIVREGPAAARGAYLYAEGKAAIGRAAAGAPAHGRLPKAARLHREAGAAFCEGDLREAWRKSSEAVRYNPHEPRYAFLRRDVAAALCARGDRPTAWTVRRSGDWTDPRILNGPTLDLPAPCPPGCRCGACAGGVARRPRRRRPI